MAVTVTGILRDAGGNAAPNKAIKFYTTKGFDGALPSATLEVTTSGTGQYNFELSTGIHILSVQYNDSLTKVNKVTVTSDVPSPQTLDSLLAFKEPLLPDEIIIVQQLVARANESAIDALQSEQNAAESEQEVESDRQEVAQNTSTVTQLASEVATNTQTVSDKAQQVSDDADQVAQDKLAVANNTQTVANNTQSVSDNAAQVSEDKDAVTQMLSDTEAAASSVEGIEAEVEADRAEVEINAQQVAADTATTQTNANQVTSDKIDVASNAAAAQQAATEAKQITGLDTVDEAVAQQAPGQVAQTVEQQSGGMNRYRQDANGNWNMMVKIPMFTNKIVNDVLGTNWLPEEDVHPAFIRPDGTTMPWFEFGMYQASNDGNGNPVSAAYKDPYTNINFDETKTKCQAMGVGWGMTSNAQWAAIALWSLANGYQPLGNTYYGYSHEKSYLGGIRQDGGINGDTSGNARILTGSGPVEFRHNKIMQGISDMVGNIWEWVDGMKSVGGQIFVATRERQDEAEWEAQSAYLDDGNRLNSEITGATNTNVTWASLGKSETYIANQLLQQLMIEPIVETVGVLGRLYYNNSGERIPRRGGSWNSGSPAGFGALVLNDERSNRFSDRGFRPAYFE